MSRYGLIEPLLDSPIDISVTVVSKNRAMQLEALLRSMRRFALDLWPPTVIYTSSTSDYSRGYEILQAEYICNWIRQGPDFKKDILSAVDQNKLFACWFVDDDIFYRSLPDFKARLFESGSGYAYAPRLGKNCTYCYNVDKPQLEGTLDFGSTLSLDGHIYWTKEILPRVKSISFTNPNELEHYLCISSPDSAHEFKLLYEECNCLVGIPHNRVQDQFPNRTSGGVSAKELNDRFLAGERIDLDAMNFSGVKGVHWPVKYEFKRS